MIVISHHRSLDLALGHLTQLQKRYFHAEMISRRDASGRYSTRGRTFIFEVREKKRREQKTEFVVHFDYGTRKGNNLIRFQVHIFGPATASDTQAIRAIRAIEQGERPKGWKVKTIFWGHPPQAANNEPDKRTDQVQPAAIFAGSAEVSKRRKIPTSKNRRSRKAKQK